MSENKAFDMIENKVYKTSSEKNDELPPIIIQDQSQLSEKSAKLAKESLRDTSKKNKFRIMKNVLLVGGSWILLFTAFQSIANLQSSLNNDSGLGTASLSTVYVALIIGSILLPTTMMDKLGIKWTIVVCQASYILYIVANIYAKYWTIIPAAILLGLGAAPLWSAKCVFLTDLGTYYAQFSGETSEIVISRFFGIFFAMFQSSNVWGNVISSTVLKPVPLGNTTDISDLSLCGVNDCPNSNSTETRKPEQQTVYILCGIYIALALSACCLLTFFLDSYKKIGIEKIIPKKSSISMLVNTLKHIRNKKQILVIPITLFSGFEQAFISADFTKSFITCILGIESVGLVMICYGVVDTFGSYGFGYLSKLIGRFPCFVIASILNYVAILIMLFWIPTSENRYILYLIAIMWGLGDAVWQTQINALYGVIFKNQEEAAFSNYRLWESLGFAIAYAYSNYICINVKLYLLIGYLTIGMIGYGLIEYGERKINKNHITPF